jgi:hypothetical protein
MTMMRRSPAAPLTLLIVAALITGCSGATAPPSPRMPSAPASVAPASTVPSVAPPPSVTPRPSTTPATGPSPLPSVGLFDPGRTLDPATVRWPADIIDAAISLAVLDNSIKEAGADLTTAAQQEDLSLMLGAAAGLASVIEAAQPFARLLVGYDATKAVGEAYVPVLAELDGAASALAAGLRAGDGAQVQTASARLGTALQAYRGVRAGMVEIADQAILMRRGALE